MTPSRFSVWGVCTLVLASVLAAALAQAEAQPKAAKLTVVKDSEVSLEYTLKLDDQSLVESNVGKEPIVYTHGKNQLIPGLEKGLEGMAVGESRHVTVPPAEAYGEVDPTGIQEVKKELIPEAGRKVGAQLDAKSKDGRVMPLRVKEVKEETVVVDFNHPLAGKTLLFDIKVLDIKAPGDSQGKGKGKEKASKK